LLLSEGQMSDYKGAALMIDAIPAAKAMLGDRGYDADWFRAALIARGIVPCIPSKANRKIQIPHDRVLYRKRHKIENMFGRIKD
jgi:transposase